MDDRKWIADGFGCNRLLCRTGGGRTDVLPSLPGVFRCCAGTISYWDRSSSIPSQRWHRAVVFPEPVGSEVIVYAHIGKSLFKACSDSDCRPRADRPRLFDAGTGEVMS